MYSATGTPASCIYVGWQRETSCTWLCLNCCSISLFGEQVLYGPFGVQIIRLILMRLSGPSQVRCFRSHLGDVNTLKAASMHGGTRCHQSQN